MLVSQIQKINNLANSRIFDHDHMFGEHFQERQQAAFDVEPGIGVELCYDRYTFFWMGYRDLMILPTPKS